MKEKRIIKVCSACFGCLLFAFLTFTAVRGYNYKKITSAAVLNQEETFELQNYLVTEYPQNFDVLKNLPYNISEQNLDVWAKSAVLIDVSNGNILYRKNENEVIPPASMTKLFAMYVVDEEVSSGNFSYDQIIPLPPESWACNMPPHSSLMFLGEGQIVTLEELMLGLSICSGNDAAYALAYTICGSMEAFVERMNQVADNLGLENTHFVECSGYSELNTTTAIEMAEFCKIYLENHPDSLKRYHSVQSFTYPKEHNLAPGDVSASQDFSQGLPARITMPITQRNTNPLLGVLDGVDGLKTGYIDESGYNLSLTAKRNNTRFVSITMGGPGGNSKEGQAGRVHDGTQLMEWAFSSFGDYSIETYVHPYFIHTFNGSEKGVNLIPVVPDKTLTVPLISGKTLEDNIKNIKVYLNIDDYGWGEIKLGQICGSIKIVLNDYTLQTIPLIADRNVKKGNFIKAMSDRILIKFKGNSL